MTDGVAIIGMAGRFPGASNIAQFWQNLCAGKESIVFFNDQELAASRDPHYVNAAARLEDVEWFDAGFFGYSPKEATVMDPQHRLFLECAWEALEEAGYASDKYDGSIGVYAGAAINTYLSAYARRLGNLEGDVLTTFLGNAVDFLSTRVSYKLNLRGPSLNIQTACSTSLVATHLACQSLLHGECDMALAGGVSIKITPTPGYFYQPGGIASPDGHCRAFDSEAQGTLFGDGVGVVVLKRVVDAMEDGDHIYACIRGSAINNDGASKVGYTAPSVNGQAEVIAEALAVAGVEADTVGYVEAHGTGTALGDPIEIAALSQAFRRGTARNAFCAIGSVKTNIGHLDAAAGIAGLIKGALVVHSGMLPPSLHFEQPNPEIDFAHSPFFVNTKLQEWKSGPTPRRAGVSSFGMGGTNAHLVLEEATCVEVAARNSDVPFHLLMLSAKTESALHALAARYGRYFDVHPEVKFSDACFTSQLGRVHFPHRLAVVAARPEQARESLANFVAGRCLEGTFRGVVATDGAPKIAFVFPGEWTALAGMSGELYASSPVFRAAFDECRSAAELSTQYALVALWKSWGVTQSSGANLFVEMGPRSANWQQMLSAVAELYVSGVEIDWAALHRPYARRRVSLPTYPFERRRYWMEDAEKVESFSEVSEVRKRINDAAPGARLDLLIAFLQSEVVHVLGLDASDPIDTRQGFFDMGMESLAALELKSRLESGLDCALPSTFAMNYPTIEALASFIAGPVLGLEVPAPAPEDKIPEFADLGSLTEDDLAALLDSELEQILGQGAQVLP